jgi:alkylhydroperoxidase family enzyme
MCILDRYVPRDAHDETEERVHLLNAWHEASPYSDGERAALAWIEAVRLVAQTSVSRQRSCGSPQAVRRTEPLMVTVSVGAIHTSNRLAISARVVPAGARDTREWGETERSL